MFHDTSPIGYLSFDAQAHVTQMNAIAAKLLGVNRKMFMGMPLPAALESNEVPKFLEHLYRCRSGAETHISTELKLGKRIRSQIPVELATTPTTIHGQLRFPTAIIDLRRSERRLQTMLQAKELAEYLFDFVSYPLAALNENLIIEATNSAFREKFRARASDIQGRSIFDLEVVHWHDAAFAGSLQRVTRHRESMREFTIECTLSVSGERLTLLANAKRLVPRPPARPLILLTFEDITHRRRHEQEREAMLAELQEMNATLEARVRERIADLNAANEQLQKLSQRVLDAHEAERRHLARELHDEIGQELTGLNMLLHRTSEARGTAFRDALRDSRSIVARLLQQVRRLSIDLRPHVLDDLGLRAAVESHLREFSKRTALPVEFAAEDFAEDSLASGPRTVAFRLVQEALTNAARHAAARHVSIRLRNDDENLFVDVKDDGKGFDPSAHANNGGCGLAGMRERVALAGGQLSIESSPGRGTHVSARLPLCGRPTGGRLK